MSILRPSVTRLFFPNLPLTELIGVRALLLLQKFNGDGKPDLAVANFGSNNVSILLGDGFGGFGPATNFAGQPEPAVVATGDFNKDGKTDLAVDRLAFAPGETTKTISVPILGDVLDEADETFKLQGELAADNITIAP